MCNFQHESIILLSPFWKITNTLKLFRILPPIYSNGVFKCTSNSYLDFNLAIEIEANKVNMSKVIFAVSVAFFVTILVSHGMFSIQIFDFNMFFFSTSVQLYQNAAVFPVFRNDFLFYADAMSAPQMSTSFGGMNGTTISGGGGGGNSSLPGSGYPFVTFNKISFLSERAHVEIAFEF